MFTGIIREVGEVLCCARNRGCRRLSVNTSVIAKGLDVGESVAVDGVCLTVVANTRGALSFDVMEETVRRTTIKGFSSGRQVNLEGALRAGQELGGHLVQGHVDCVGTVTGAVRRSSGSALSVSFPSQFSHLIVGKGSITVDGVSLTLGEIMRNSLTLHLIPHTLESTTLKSKRAGDYVNLEFDIIGKYVARLKQLNGEGRVTEEFLRAHGF